MVKRVLMVAYHYPPMRGGSGIQRALKFSQYLPLSGWQPVVLSASPHAYPERGMESGGDIGPGITVHRSFALDTARHLGILGRYPGLLAQPDRWISWWLSAVPAGLRLIRRYRPDVIWSSYPIATAHLIALTLHKLSGIPWVADQRDPLTDSDYPPDSRRRSIHRWIEAKAAQHSAAMVCTTPGAIRALRGSFPHLAENHLTLIENGYDEASFIEAALAPPVNLDRLPQRFQLLHSGVIYPSERDPRPLFAALRRMLVNGNICAANFQLRLRATGHDDYLRPLLREYGIIAIVELAPALPYREALAEMMAADGLLLLQASNCNGQIPAKLYEYLRAGRPLLALADPAGDTASALHHAGIDTIASLASETAIVSALLRFLDLCGRRQAPVATPATIARHSRSARTVELAALLDRVHHVHSVHHVHPKDRI